MCRDLNQSSGVTWKKYQLLVILEEQNQQIKQMSKNTSISLGNYFDQFVQTQVSTGRYKNVSEVIRAGLRLLENEESKAIALKSAIREGIDSGIADDFDSQRNLAKLKARKRQNG